MTTSYIATLDCCLSYNNEPPKSSLLNPSRRPSNHILLNYVQLLAPSFLLLYCTQSFINCLYIVSHIPQLSIFITADETYAQPGEESLFPEESRSTPWESTCIEESSPSSSSIQSLPRNYLALCIVLLMTSVHDWITDAGWQYRSADRWWPKRVPREVYLIVLHQWRRSWSPTGGPGSRPGMQAQVIMNYMCPTARDTELCEYFYCTTSASKFLKSSWRNGTTTAETPKVNPPQQIIQVWPWIIHPGTAAAQV